MTVAKKEKPHYVDNKKFYAEIVKYREACEQARAEGVQEPRLPNYIGECIWKIATKLSYKPCFMNYSFRDEMIEDGIENCIMYFKDFDINKTQNPFAYFTQIIYYAFLRRISKEERNRYTTYKYFQETMILPGIADIGVDNTELSETSNIAFDESSIALTLTDIVRGYDGEESFMKRISQENVNGNSRGETYDSINFSSEFPPGKSNILPGDVVKRLHTNTEYKTTKRIISSFKLYLEPDKSDADLFDSQAYQGHLQPAQGMIKPWPAFNKETSVLKFMFRDILVIVGGQLGQNDHEGLAKVDATNNNNSNKLPADNDYVEDIDIGEGPSDFDRDFAREFDRDSAEVFHLYLKYI